MERRRGTSLLNVMVFMMLAVAVTSQVFFFAKWSSESVADERDIATYRAGLDSLVELAKSALEISVDKGVKISHNASNGVTFENFCEKTKLDIGRDISEWKNAGYDFSVHDLNYTFDSDNFNRNEWTAQPLNERVFSPMPPDSDGEYFLIRACVKLPENYYGKKLMYQVLVRRKENVSKYKVQTLSHQEIWF